MKSFESDQVVAQVDLGADENNGRFGTIELDLVVPFRFHVLERRRIHNAEANEKHVGLRIGERAQTVVVFLAGRVPQSDVDCFVVDHYISRIVVEHSRDVLAWERVRCVAHEQTRFTNRSIIYSSLISFSIFENNKDWYNFTRRLQQHT